MADAENGKLDPVIGRDEEIRRVIQAPGDLTRQRCLGTGWVGGHSLHSLVGWSALLHITTRVEAIAHRLEATATRVEASL